MFYISDQITYFDLIYKGLNYLQLLFSFAS